MPKNRDPGQRYARVRDDFRISFPWQKVRRDDFIEFARLVRDPVIRHINRYDCASLKAGRPVPLEVMEAFSEYISQEKLGLGRYLFSQIAEIHELSESDEEEIFDPWRARRTTVGSWAALFHTITRAFDPPGMAFCQEAGDFQVAGRMIMERVGVSYEKFTSGDDSIHVAEKVMNITIDSYVKFLERLWRSNKHAIMFAINRETNLKRIGVCIMVAVTEEAGQRLRNGEEAYQLTDEDLRHQSRILHANAMAEARGFNARSSALKASMCSTYLYQAALLLPRLQIDDEFHLIGFGGTKENARRLSKYNFIPTGAITRQTGKAVVEFGPPDENANIASSFLHRAEFFASRAIIQLYQHNIYHTGKLMDNRD